MKTKAKYLLNIEGKRRFRGNTWLELILNVVKCNHDKRKSAKAN